MNSIDRSQMARDIYLAYASGERGVVEHLLGEDFSFHSPDDANLDRKAYFERCWPNAAHIEGFEFKRVIESGEEVVVTYECTRTDGSRFRNTEVLRFSGEKLIRTEVYYGWNLD
jgi:hypothetical protein